MNANPAPAVVVDGVSKTFKLPHERMHTLKERALHPFRRSGYDQLRVLQDVSVSVQRGEFFGIVGRNGSGKSTLLKCLAGIYATDTGAIYVDGRMSTFIELGVGFNMDLPARDNVLINATMLGLSPREARRRFESIIDFAELHQFVDLKLKNYSSGMLVRLAFSVMIQVDANILLIDEVLAVGDAAFQQKCFDEFARIRESGATMLLVTHDMSAVERFCDRAMLLERGHVVETGLPDKIGSRYLELNFSKEARAAQQAEHAPAIVSEAEAALEQSPPQPAPVPEPEPEPEQFGDGKATIAEAWFEDEHGQRTEVLHSGRRCSFVFRARFHEQIADPLFGINVHNSGKDLLLTANNVYMPPSGVFEAGDEATVRFAFDNVWAQDRYHVSPAIAHSGGGLRWIDRRNRLVSAMVISARSTDALVDVPVELGVERQTRAKQTDAVR